MGMPDPAEEEDDFDFEAECIRAYRDAGDNLENRIKVLSLLKSVHLAKKGVKGRSDEDDGDPAARAVQDELNGVRS